MIKQGENFKHAFLFLIKSIHNINHIHNRLCTSLKFTGKSERTADIFGKVYL